MPDLTVLKNKVLTLSSRPTDRFMELAYALRALKKRSREEFRRVVKKAGLGTRKSYYLLNLADQFHSTPGIRARPHQTPDIRARLHQIGWTKAQVISRHRTNILKLLEYAEGHTTKELEAYAGGMEADPGTRCVLLYFTDSEYRLFEKALIKFRAKKSGRGLVGKEKATIKMAREAILTDQ
jgi:hypothetical protein